MNIGDNIAHIVETHRAELKTKRGFVGASLCVVKKMVAGQETDILCVRLYVSKKRPTAELALADLLPMEIEGLATDVMESGKPVADWFFWRRAKAENLFAPPAVYGQRHRPLTPGWGIGLKGKGTGTLGAIGVFTESGGESHVVGITNNHVAYGMASVEHPGRFAIELVHQPGFAYGAEEGKDGVGWAWLPQDLGQVLLLTEKGLNYRDLAIIYLPPSQGAPNLQVQDIGYIRGRRGAEMGLECQETGFVVGHQQGKRVFDPAAFMLVTYPGVGDLEFTDTFLVEPLGVPGHSGSAILSMDNEVVGIHFAGSSLFSLGMKEKYIPPQIRFLGVL